MPKEKPDVESGSPPKQEREATKKIIRVLTVLAYLSSVSTAAIMLSLYYIFLWNPMPTHAAQTMTSVDIPLIQVIGPQIRPKSGMTGKKWPPQVFVSACGALALDFVENLSFLPC